MFPLIPQSIRAIQKLSFSQVSDEQFNAVLLDLNVAHIDPELKNAALGLLAGKGIDNVADLIQSPSAVMQLVQFIKGGLKATSLIAADKPAPVECSVCNGVTEASLVSGTIFNVCTKCGTIQ